MDISGTHIGTYARTLTLPLGATILSRSVLAATARRRDNGLRLANERADGNLGFARPDPSSIEGDARIGCTRFGPWQSLLREDRGGGSGLDPR